MSNITITKAEDGTWTLGFTELGTDWEIYGFKTAREAKIASENM